jgi:hypothetical protein
MLPHVRIRIVPGWVKVYLVNVPHNAPLAAYQDEAVLGGYALSEPMLKSAA